MKVINKLESIKIIKEKKLNSFPEKLFYRDQKKEILQFLMIIQPNIMLLEAKKLLDVKKIILKF